MEMEKKSCCVFGHRKIDEIEELIEKVSEVFENLILNENVCTFYYGSRSDFDRLCRFVLMEMKEKYPHIQRVYVRGEYPYINEDYEKYLLERCDKTYFPERALNAGRRVYVIRNQEMVDNSNICVVYYKEDYLPPRKKLRNRDWYDYQPKSGTGMAYTYALKKKRIIINLAE